MPKSYVADALKPSAFWYAILFLALLLKDRLLSTGRHFALILQRNIRTINQTKKSLLR